MIYMYQNPRIPYYAWQVEVNLYQHEKLGMDLSQFHILLGYSWQENDLSNRQDVVEMYDKLQQRFPTANFYHYEDTRKPITYIPSIIPHLIKKHFAANPWLEQETIFHCDVDMIFTKVPDYSDLEQDDTFWMSDSRGFINWDYINYKRPIDLVEGMCQIVGVTPEQVKEFNNQSGGSQYIFKKTTYDFWDKVERDSDALYAFFQRTEPERYKRIEGYYGIQQFAAGMWAFLWNCWYYGHKTDITQRLAFCWSTDLVKRWEETEIFHNAGCTVDKAQNYNLFYKGAYTNHLPYDDVLTRQYNEQYANHLYANIIREVAKNTCLK